MAEVLEAGIDVVVAEAVMAGLPLLFLAGKVGEPVETSCWEEEEAEVEVEDVGEAFLMAPMRVESFEGSSGCQSCGP